MTSKESEFCTILDQVSQYLSQHRELYGEEIYVNRGETKLETIFPESNNKSYSNLTEFYEAIKDCRRCSLAATRTHLVFGEGDPGADLMLIGEAPGYDEDIQGEPFVGRAGQLLNKILEAIHFKRADVYIANVLKCRPPQNRDPLPEEIECCEPYLWKQIELIAPKVILALGRIAAQTLLKTSRSMGDLRGQIHHSRGIKLVVTYHPAALLRHPEWKKATWTDVQLLRKIYDEIVG